MTAPAYLSDVPDGEWTWEGRTIRNQFRLLGRYAAIRLGLDRDELKTRDQIIVESERRNYPEPSYAYVRLVWWMRYVDGRTMISVPPGARDVAARFATGRHHATCLPDESEAQVLIALINKSQARRGGPQASRVMQDLILACNHDTLRGVELLPALGSLVRLCGPGWTYAPGLRPPEQCFPDGVAYGVVKDGMVVAVAFAHRTGLMEDRVADLGVETAEEYRRRGYGRAVVHAVTNHLVSRGGEAWYACSPENVASQATAHSVGYIPYATSLALAT
jgi:ribosomal protein S18 acetylase RimI-like enzyme